jgi:hypothetical protein
MRAMAGGKPRPNHGVYISVLRAMTPEQRLRKAFELGAMTRAMLEHGLRRRFPHLDDTGLAGLVRQHLDRCHNRNY